MSAQAEAPRSDSTAAGAQTVARWTTSQPQGTCTELIVYAVALEDDEFEQTPREYIRPNLIRVVADSVTQKELDGKHKIECELWSHGFAAPADFPGPNVLPGSSATPTLAGTTVQHRRRDPLPRAVHSTRWTLRCYRRCTGSALCS